MTSNAEVAMTGAPDRLPAELFVLPIGQSEYLIYAPLRRAALIANAPLVRFLRELQAGEMESTGPPK